MITAHSDGAAESGGSRAAASGLSKPSDAPGLSQLSWIERYSCWRRIHAGTRSDADPIVFRYERHRMCRPQVFPLGEGMP